MVYTLAHLDGLVNPSVRIGCWGEDSDLSLEQARGFQKLTRLFAFDLELTEMDVRRVSFHKVLEVAHALGSCRICNLSSP